MSEIAPAVESPFDVIRRVDERGDFWTGRDLMTLLGYDKWERMVDAIERARISLANAKADPEVHASRLREPSGRTERTNYRFTRHGAYVLAMCADVRKTDVARAQAYFAEKTREAETGVVAVPEPRHPEIPQTYADALQAAADQARERERLEIENATLKPAAQSWQHLASAEGDFLVGDAAKILQRDPVIRAGGKCRPNVLFKTLYRELGWIYKRGHRDRWHAKQSVIDKGWMVHRAQSFCDPDGVWHTGDPQVRLTVAGIYELHRQYGGDQPLALNGPDEGPTQLELPGGAA